MYLHLQVICLDGNSKQYVKLQEDKSFIEGYFIKCERNSKGINALGEIIQLCHKSLSLESIQIF